MSNIYSGFFTYLASFVYRYQISVLPHCFFTRLELFSSNINKHSILEHTFILGFAVEESAPPMGLQGSTRRRLVDEIFYYEPFTYLSTYTKCFSIRFLLAECPHFYFILGISSTALALLRHFIISLFILTSLLSLSNIDFESSFKLAILTLMNTVNSSAYGLSDFNFIDLHFITKYFLIFFMIIGRVELLSLLLIAKKFLFKY